MWRPESRKVARTSPGWLPGYFFGSQAIFWGGSQAPRSSQAIFFGGSQAPRSSQAPRASVAPNYRLPGSSQLVAQIPGSQLLPAGNQNHWRVLCIVRFYLETMEAELPGAWALCHKTATKPVAYSKPACCMYVTLIVRSPVAPSK